MQIIKKRYKNWRFLSIEDRLLNIRDVNSSLDDNEIYFIHNLYILSVKLYESKYKLCDIFLKKQLDLNINFLYKLIDNIVLRINVSKLPNYRLNKINTDVIDSRGNKYINKSIEVFIEKVIIGGMIVSDPLKLNVESIKLYPFLKTITTVAPQQRKSKTSGKIIKLIPQVIVNYDITYQSTTLDQEPLITKAIMENKIYNITFYLYLQRIFNDDIFINTSKYQTVEIFNDIILILSSINHTSLLLITLGWILYKYVDNKLIVNKENSLFLSYRKYILELGKKFTEYELRAKFIFYILEAMYPVDYDKLMNQYMNKSRAIFNELKKISNIIRQHYTRYTYNFLSKRVKYIQEDNNIPFLKYYVMNTTSANITVQQLLGEELASTITEIDFHSDIKYNRWNPSKYNYYSLELEKDIIVGESSKYYYKHRNIKVKNIKKNEITLKVIQKLYNLLKLYGLKDINTISNFGVLKTRKRHTKMKYENFQYFYINILVFNTNGNYSRKDQENLFEYFIRTCESDKKKCGQIVSLIKKYSEYIDYFDLPENLIQKEKDRLAEVNQLRFEIWFDLTPEEKTMVDKATSLEEKNKILDSIIELKSNIIS